MVNSSWDIVKDVGKYFYPGLITWLFLFGMSTLFADGNFGAGLAAGTVLWIIVRVIQYLRISLYTFGLEKRILKALNELK
ncbi:hypothetical protein AB1L42_07960 [Thalassoglobus sp. JC818]|uniref:hypothetical protein n=1 Tax=Thalassoglobus sp. JC818 TaxID=3232136 RepID=UPI003459B4F8